MRAGPVDPILIAIIPNRMRAIAEEMARTLMMTSRSGIFAEARDFVTAIFDGEARLVTQSEYFPGFAGALPYILPPILARYAGDIHEGDVFIVNDPYAGNSHLPDLNIVKPVFAEGALRFWVCCKGHMADIGGRGVAGYDPNGASVWDEGIVIPPLKLYDRSRINDALLELLFRNIRAAEIVSGDIRCMVGGATIGERGLLKMLEEYGAGAIRAHVEAFFVASEKEMREKIGRIPEGVYRGEKSVEDVEEPDRPVTVRVTVTVRDRQVTLDFSESDRQRPRYLNSTDAFTRSMGTLTLFWILEQSRSNHGSLRPIAFVNPRGTCVNVEFPGTSTLATCTMAECIQEAVQLALAPAVPAQVAAGSAKILFQMFTGVHPKTGKPFVNLDFFSRCQPSGGTEGYDGWEQGGPAQELGKGRCPDVEIHELTYPVRVLTFEEEPDSAGAGKFRGGNGHVYRVQYLADAEPGVIFGSGTRPFAVPAGLFGGRAPKPSVTVIERAEGRTERVEPNTFVALRKGDILALRAMGGPGFGDPLERDVERVRRDVADGFVSREQAREAYGVVFAGDTLQVDAEATARLRAERQRAGPASGG